MLQVFRFQWTNRAKGDVQGGADDAADAEIGGAAGDRLSKQSLTCNHRIEVSTGVPPQMRSWKACTRFGSEAGARGNKGKCQTRM